MRHSWDSHDTVMRQSWDIHETVMRQLRDSQETFMRQSWDNHKTVMRHSWDSHEEVFFFILHQLQTLQTCLFLSVQWKWILGQSVTFQQGCYKTMACFSGKSHGKIRFKSQKIDALMFFLQTTFFLTFTLACLLGTNVYATKRYLKITFCG